MPLEALLFVLQHIWLAVFVLTLGISIGTGINFGLDVVALLITLGMFVLFFMPIVSIGQNIVQSRKDIRKVLCCVPLLIAAVYQTLVVVFGYTKFMIYESHPDSLVYALLLPVQRLGKPQSILQLIKYSTWVFRITSCLNLQPILSFSQSVCLFIITFDRL